MRILIALMLLTAVVLLPLSLFAVLGDTAASVLNDQARMKGSLRSTDHQAYVLHEITAPSGTVVREYVSPAGAVFAVTWEGQFPPDLEQLLGPYYQQAKQALQQQQESEHRRRAPLSVVTPGLVLTQSGHVRAFHGQAYIPQLMPQAVTASDIR